MQTGLFKDEYNDLYDDLYKHCGCIGSIFKYLKLAHGNDLVVKAKHLLLEYNGEGSRTFSQRKQRKIRSYI